MALPEIIEIIPPSAIARARVKVPGSKSVTNRALVLAALASESRTLKGALWSEDTQVMVACLRQLGVRIAVGEDPNELSNRTLKVQGSGGTMAMGGTETAPLELFVGNAGTAARFLAALVCLGKGVYRLSGVPRMHERPQGALLEALSQLGYRVVPEEKPDRLPVRIYGDGPRPARCRVTIQESSQFASALILCAERGGWDVDVVGENAEETPYIAMTRELCALFVRSFETMQVEPDASSGSYFWAAGRLLGLKAPPSDPVPLVEVCDWPKSGWQVDERFAAFWPLPEVISRARDLGDSIMTAMMLAPFGESPVRFTDLGRLRLQECERVKALRTELTKCGVDVEESGDTLVVRPSQGHGATIETYNDHRIAMCFAILGLKIPGIRLKNPSCVKKTFPDFFAKLALSPPHGLGAGIIDVSQSQPRGMAPEELSGA